VATHTDEVTPRAKGHLTVLGQGGLLFAAAQSDSGIVPTKQDPAKTSEPDRGCSGAGGGQSDDPGRIVGPATSSDGGWSASIAGHPPLSLPHSELVLLEELDPRFALNACALHGVF
jgi:hypothetical protein